MIAYQEKSKTKSQAERHNLRAACADDVQGLLLRRIEEAAFNGHTLTEEQLAKEGFTQDDIAQHWTPAMASFRTNQAARSDARG